MRNADSGVIVSSILLPEAKDNGTSKSGFNDNGILEFENTMVRRRQ